MAGTCVQTEDASSSPSDVIHTLESFRELLAKCEEERARASHIVGKLRSSRQYPHTGYYQFEYGTPAQTNCRTKDKLASVHGVVGRLRPSEMLDIYRANVRFQVALQNLVLTKHMLTGEVNEFIRLVTEYELLSSPSAAVGCSTAATSPGAASDEAGVSSTTAAVIGRPRVAAAVAAGVNTTGNDDNDDDDEDDNNDDDDDDDDVVMAIKPTIATTSSSSSSSAAAAAASSATSRATLLWQIRGRIGNQLKIIQSMLNQMPMLASILHVELRLMRIYDHYDDSPIVHRLLTDQQTTALLGGMAEVRSMPVLLHDWNLLVSDEIVRQKARALGGRARRPAPRV